MLPITLSILDIPSISELSACLCDGGDSPIQIGGLLYVHTAHLAAALKISSGRSVVLVSEDEASASRLASDVEALSGETPVLLLSRDLTFSDVEGVSREFEHKRIAALWRIASGAGITIATIDALTLKTLPKNTLTENSITLRSGEQYNLSRLAARLTSLGYKRSAIVEGAGQFALRGGILDVFSPSLSLPCRMEFFGDEVDSMGVFDPDSQRRTQNIDTFTILPAAEVLPGLAEGGEEGLKGRIKAALAAALRRKNPPKALENTILRDLERFEEQGSFPAADRYLSLCYGEGSALEYLPENSVIILSEPSRIFERTKATAMQTARDVEILLERGSITASQGEYYVNFSRSATAFKKHICILADAFQSSVPQLLPKRLMSVTAKLLPAYLGSINAVCEDLKHYRAAGVRTVMLAGSERRCRHLLEILARQGVEASLNYNLSELPKPGGLTLAVGNLSAGMEYPAINLAVISEGQLTAQRKEGLSKRSKSAPGGERKRLKSFSDLNVHDLVVHVNHGIGRFDGINKLTVDGVTRDFIKISYAGGDELFVPATQLDTVSKYIGAGGEDTRVRLNKLGGQEWTRAKSRAKSAAKDLAAGLIKLYAERQRMPGFAFSPDSEWQKEFEEGFDYDETEDQLRCTAEIKADMEKPVPMDRLLCGDVGFGKTEVAFRAAMKCVMDGRQVAILVPTTVLARQHFLTASERFLGYPVSIDMLTRFVSPENAKKVYNKLKEGGLDIVIGTHRLLQKNMEFKTLGLLIVDEEQRFGVAHKERLKEISRSVDVLTLSATPIPRTLNSALSGIRDMSQLELPPRDRHPVQTYVLEYDEGVVLDAIRREISRGGQVYYLRNLVEGIERIAGRLRELLPEVRIGVGHGQMDEHSLSSVMRAMSEGDLDVLVCTTIIETGIDIPNVNTLIIEDADRLGLAQLHQIRGRVGRSSRHAYAYLTYRRGKVLTELSQKRLSAIREFAEFGAGFKIAMRDLEIRGAGNLLGSEQSGHMMSVGYDMYLRLLEEAVLEEKGETAAVMTDCTVDIPADAHIPESYISSAPERMDIYRRVAFVSDEESARDITDELYDRYGQPPVSVMSLIDVALLRERGRRLGIKEISLKDNQIVFSFEGLTGAEEEDKRRIAAIFAACGSKEFRGRLRFNASGSPYLALRLNDGDSPLDMSVKVAEKLATAQVD